MPSYSKADLIRAIRAQCCECNDVHGGWHAGNDCTGTSCKLYPYRPGDGPGHAQKLQKRKNTPEAAAIMASRLQNVRHRKAKTPEIGTAPISGAGVRP